MNARVLRASSVSKAPFVIPFGAADDNSEEGNRLLVRMMLLFTGAVG
jgi:hypothetical protein